MDFDGYGLDFIEGKKTLSLIRTHGFPEGKTLFAGVIDGRNIWRIDPHRAAGFITGLEKAIDKNRIVLSTSCSLLHVPYSLSDENKLSEEQKSRFAFAQEKLKELNDLKSLLSELYALISKKGQGSVFLGENAEDGKEGASNINEQSFIRRPGFDEREKIQKEVFNLPLLPLTTIGSFPQTREIKSLRHKYKKGEISEAEYESSIKEKIAACIALQEDLDFDVLVHGEYERNDMVEYFGENLKGFTFTENGWVQSYGTRCVKPPIIVSDIRRKRPITIEYSAYAQSLTDKPVKGMLTGPVTILNWSFPRTDIPRSEIAFQLAAAIREEVLDLEAAGIKVIQIDEAALKEKLPLRRTDWHDGYLSWAIPAFRAVHCGVRPETQIHSHMCYSEFEDMLDYIEQMDADVISFEAARSNLSILQAISESGFKTQVGPGVYDIHSPRVPKKEELLFIIDTMLGLLPKEKLWINPDCGLKTRGEEETIASLKTMVETVKMIRKKIK